MYMLAVALGPGIEKTAQYDKQLQGSWYEADHPPKATLYSDMEISTSSKSSLEFNGANTLADDC